MPNLRSLPLCALAVALFSNAVLAQSPAPAVRILNKIDVNHLVALKGNVNPLANAENDRGPVSAGLAMSDLTLVLNRSAEQQAAFDAFVEDQYNPGSPSFHQWLTPEEVGERFGPAQADIAAVTGWLASQGFAVTAVSPDRMTISFKGTAGQAQSAFHTSIHNLSVKGVSHIANMTDPQIPEALSAVVIGVKGLHNFIPHPLHRTGSLVQLNSSSGGSQRLQDSPAASLASGGLRVSAAKPASSLRPLYGYTDSNSSLPVEDVAPYDFATIYNVLPLWNKATPITGTGQTIAVIGTSDINVSDVATFKSTFGLPAGLTPIQAKGVNGTDPGVCTSTSATAVCGIGDLEENSLDVEWSGAVAPGAQIVLVTSGNTNTNDPIFQSAQYVISNVNTSASPLYHAHIMSISYGACELGMGTASNVAYRNLWQTAATAGIAVFIASGDSGSPACDQGGDSDGNPYEAQYGLSVNGLASTPFNTAVGGTDFTWCKPAENSGGTAVVGCTSATAGTYWNTSNSGTNASNAKGYVPEAPWNDSCLNSIWAAYLESIAPLLHFSAPINAEAACNFVYNNWKSIYTAQANAGNPGFVLAYLVDSVGAGGGASNCVVSNGNDASSCNSSTSSTGSLYGSLPLVNDGWPKPSWQTGVTGLASGGSRSLPDVSFFSGDGSLNSATLVCLAVAGAPCTSSNISGTALEIGGTSVATPEMAGVMALINQNTGTAQGLPNAGLYKLGGMQTYSSCSAESGSTSSSCYFNDVDQGTISMPCAVSTSTLEGGALYSGGWNVNAATSAALASPNCTALNSGDLVGTLVSTGTTPGYTAGVGFDLATGLGSLNVANVANATGVWLSTGTAAATVTVTPTSNSITTGVSLGVTVAVSGASGTPTGTITLASGSYISSASLASGSATFTVPAHTLPSGTDTLTANYNGDSTYAPATGTASVAVAALPIPAITITPASNSVNSGATLGVTVAVTGTPTPTGTVTLTAGTYTSAATTLAGGNPSFTVPANSFTTSSATITATYAGDSNWDNGSKSTTEAVTQSTFGLSAGAPSPTSVTKGASASVAITGTASTNGYTGTVSFASGSCVATAGPASAVSIPVCSSSGTITYAGGTATGTANLSVTTTAASAELVYPKVGNGKGWLGAGGGAVLAFLVFLGIPARRRSWRAMLGMVTVLAALGTLTACSSGGGSSGGTPVAGTTSGSYTFTVTGTGSDPAATKETTTFTLTVN